MAAFVGIRTHDALNRQLTVLLGEPLDALLHPPLQFAPVMDLTSGHGRSISRLARMLLVDWERGGMAIRHPFALTSLEQFVVNELLLSHPHNCTEAIYRTPAEATSRDVKRALDYIEANLEADVRLADIVEAAGVPGRTLLKHFEKLRGVSPMEYLRSARLERVHEALGQAEPGEMVADIAMRWGFSHLGRFTTAYRRRFGELPSATRRRTR